MGVASSPSPAQQQKVRQLLREEINMFAPNGFSYSTSFSKLHLSSPACSPSQPLCMTPRNSDSMYPSHLSELWLWRDYPKMMHGLILLSSFPRPYLFHCPLASLKPSPPYGPSVCMCLTENMQLSSALLPVLV